MPGIVVHKKKCPPGKLINPKTKRCIMDTPANRKKIGMKLKSVPTPLVKKSVLKPSPAKKAVSKCPPGKLINPKTNRCVMDTPANRKKIGMTSTPAKKPGKITTYSSKSDCPTGKIYNPMTKRCIMDTPANRRKCGIPLKQKPVVKEKEKECEKGKILNPATKRCVKDTPANRKKIANLDMSGPRPKTGRLAMRGNGKTKCNASQFRNPGTKKIQLIEKILQPHQQRFREAFMKSDKHGAIAVHNVGSGKTLTAIAVSQDYLRMHPKKTVTLIAPASLISNFKKELVKFGAYKQCSYKLMTYDEYKNNYHEDDYSCENSLLIVDEAHNLRTKITGKGEGAKAEAVMGCAYAADKVLLLTATPLVNIVEDINNLLSMVTKYKNITKNNSPPLDCIFSFYEADAAYFPKIQVKDIKIVMSEKFAKEYKAVEMGAQGNFFGGVNTQYFYNGTRRAVNTLEMEKSPKIEWVEKKIRSTDENFVVFSHFLNAGNVLLEKRLKKLKIPYGYINGKVKKNVRQQHVNDFNKGKIRVLLISKSGGEGLDLKGTNNIVIIEPSWNETTINQVIGRGSRYKSHLHLPKNKQILKVWKLYMIYKSEENTFGKRTRDMTIDKMMKWKSADKEKILKAELAKLKSFKSLETCYVP